MKFSIIVPVYKIPYDMLRKCLNSILEQSYRDFEVVIIDDESPDKCGEICDEFVRRDSRFRVIHQKNAGLSVVRNVGFEESSGEWVCFVDGDDWIEKDALKVGAELLKHISSDTDVLICDAFVEFEDRTELDYFLGEETNNILEFRGNDKIKLIDLFLPRYRVKTRNRIWADIGSTWARFYKRSFILDNNLKSVPGLRRTQDNIFNLYVIDKASLICYSCKHIYHYRIRNESAARKFDKRIVENFLALYKEYMKYVDYIGDKEFEQRVYNKLVWQFTRIFANYYAHPSNILTVSKTISLIRQDLAIKEFKDAINNCDTRKQRFKIRLFHFLLKRKFYCLALCISKINEKHRK